MRIGHMVHVQTVAHVLDSILDAVPEGGVPGSVDKLVFVKEKSLCAGHAIVPAHIVRPPVLPSEGTLHGIGLRNVELVWSQSLLQVLDVAFLIGILPLGVGVEVFEFEAAEV